MTEDVGLSVQPVQFKVGLKQLMTMVMCGFLLQQFGKFLEIIPTSLDTRKYHIKHFYVYGTRNIVMLLRADVHDDFHTIDTDLIVAIFFLNWAFLMSLNPNNRCFR
ncbi:transmembrane protein, putative [Medicago truncatula]|uniref:Transmembrane protein, putative n=1 Tax=Medicago truncatula TaxID=3880 RepID=A0A072VXB6_MEDTR|nr:transmembrane protein, putative [Medicago truncatula]